MSVKLVVVFFSFQVLVFRQPILFYQIWSNYLALTSYYHFWMCNWQFISVLGNLILAHFDTSLTFQVGHQNRLFFTKTIQFLLQILLPANKTSYTNLPQLSVTGFQVVELRLLKVLVSFRGLLCYRTASLTSHPWLGVTRLSKSLISFRSNWFSDRDDAGGPSLCLRSRLRLGGKR